MKLELWRMNCVLFYCLYKFAMGFINLSIFHNCVSCNSDGFILKLILLIYYTHILKLWEIILFFWLHIVTVTLSLQQKKKIFVAAVLLLSLQI